MVNTFNMDKGRKIVVTMTSWTKRINNCAKVVRDVINGTKKPDAIYLNLSEEEFPGKEKDIPKELIALS